MIIPYSSEFFEDYLKFESDTMKEIYFFNNKDKKDMKLRDFIQVFKKIKSIREKNPIPFTVIKTFYEQPENFLVIIIQS